MMDAILYFTTSWGYMDATAGDGGKISRYIFCTWHRIQKQRKEFCTTISGESIRQDI